MPSNMPPKSSQDQQHDELSRAVARVLFPVMICMALAILLVRSVGTNSNALSQNCNLGGSRAFPIPPPVSAQPLTSSYTSSSSASSSSSSSSSSNVYSGKAGVVFVVVFIVCMVGFTFVLLLLYKYGYLRIIYAWLVLAVLLIFGYVGGVYIFDLCRSRCWNLDWISLVFIVWNFTVTGIIAVFGKAPRLVNQAYLILMSALMAFIFRNLPDAATWTIEGALVVWDLFAVLTPCGPLRKLVEIARERGESLPALVYDTNPHDVGRDDEATQPIVPRTEAERAADRERRREIREARKATAAETKTNRLASAPDRSHAVTGQVLGQAASQPSQWQQLKTILQQKSIFSKTSHGPATRAATNSRSPQGDGNSSERRGVGTLGHHLKLGLGDFVFYSILVVQASKHGALAAVVSFVAILSGLCLTLFLVVLYRKALPALPISIVLGLVFFVLGRYAIQPIADTLLQELLFH